MTVIVIWSYFEKQKDHHMDLQDYAVGLSSNDYILSMLILTISMVPNYQVPTKILKDNKLECVYCKNMLAYDLWKGTL